MKSLFLKFPLWQILRIACVLALAAIIFIPLHELYALTKSVVFYNSSNATITWDPPDSGVVDHYVVEITTSRLLNGPQNTISWVNYATVRGQQYVQSTANGYSYTFRVKAVGPGGNESPYSDKSLTLICDTEKPEFSMTSLQTSSGKVHSGDLTVRGSFHDENIASLTVDGQNARLDLANGTWSVTVPLRKDLKTISVEARDFAGNVKHHTFEVWHQPIVFSSNSRGSDLYVLGTPAYPGIYIGPTPYSVYNAINPALRIPLSVRNPGWVGLDQVVSVPQGHHKVDLSMVSLKIPRRFEIESLPALNPVWTGSGLVHPFPVDYNQDNVQDLLVGTSTGHILLVSSFYEGKNHAWSKAVPLNTSEGEPLATGQEATPFYIDVNDDFVFDLVVQEGDGRLRLFQRDGDAWRPGEFLALETPIQMDEQVFFFADWNHDRKKDLLLADGHGSIQVLLNSGTDAAPHFGPEYVLLSLPGVDSRAYFWVTDWNGDDDPDIVSQDQYGNLAVWLNTGPSGNGPFREGTPIIKAEELGARILAPAVVDWNRDGMLDLIVGTDNGQLFLLSGKE